MNAPTAAAQFSLGQESLSRLSDEDRKMIDSHAEYTAAIMYPQLARQLEYYFSEQNLFKDSYLQTLRSLNDGCVPLSILANFSKVQLITRWNGECMEEMSRRRAVIQAARDHSEYLLIYHIDAETGKVVNEVTVTENIIKFPDGRSTDSLRTILALGTRDRKPITKVVVVSPSSTINVASPLSSQSCVNTLILREVDPRVTYDDVRLLFEKQIEACPRIVSIRPDIGHCWFVVLDTTSRQEMMSVMMKLRTCTLMDNYVQARLKASAPNVLDPAAIPVIPFDVQFLGPPPQVSQRKKRNKKRHQRKKASGKNEEKKAPSQPKVCDVKQDVAPPLLGDDDFPVLPQDKKVEWEPETMKKDNEGSAEQEESSSKSSVSKLSVSDAASTATTMSSSVDSCRKALGGYAAALLKPSTSARPIKGMNKENTDRKLNEKIIDNGCTKVASIPSSQPDPSPVVAKPPSWGGGRTFADVMRSC